MEEDLFLKKMKGVQPIKKKDNYTSLKNNKEDKTTKKILKKNTNINVVEEEVLKPKTNKKSEFKISFNEINKELKRGKIKIDRRLDLHGYSLLEAKEKFKKEIIKSYNKNNRCLLVITGKGAHVKNKNTEDVGQKPRLYYGKIKNSIISWINESDLKTYILTYQNAGFEHGGDGALFVYLRRKKI